MLRSVISFLWRGLQIVLAAGLVAWATLAVYFQFDAPWRYLAFLPVLLVAGFFLWLGFQRRWGVLWLAMAASLALVMGWWATILPRDDRDWRPEVAHGVTSTEKDGLITLSNVRNFDFTTEEDAVAHWETRTVDPDKITSLDMILSVWDSPDIAHTLVSFGFADGQHIVFSAEIRKEKSEEYSSIGGFFKEFELVLLAADERDIVRLRTDVREEQVSLYPVDMPAAERKALFLSFLKLGNDLAVKPRWYNTITANCTTVPFFLVRQLTDRVVPDIRILLSGRLPSYLHELGVLRPDMTLEEIRAKALLPKQGPAIPDGAAFSRNLRAKWAE